MIDAEACASCRFWSEDAHFCRRNAPEPAVDGGGKDSEYLRVRWPLTEGGDWCGEYEPVDVEEDYEGDEQGDEDHHTGDEWAEDGSPAW